MTAMQECCHTRADTEPRDIRALRFITMELMRLKDGEAVGVDNLRRWPKAVGFLSETTSATSVESLMKVREDSVF
jgi:hypothetical protein